MDINIKMDFSVPIVIAAIFVVLKLINIITWSWIWIFSPIWIAGIIDVVIVAIVYLLSRK